jgi:cation diffusion facilitator family transporter
MAAPARDGFFDFRLDLASRAAALSFVSNVTLMVLKITVGVLTGSVAVLSDGIDSAQDAIASTFAFVSIRLASQPADEEHPYGHGKAESIAAMGQALLIGGGATYIMVRAVSRLIDRDVEIDTGPGMIALAATALVNVLVVMYVGYAARTTGSVALKADTRHLWTNVFQAAAVIAALALVAVTGNSIFDPIVALGLAVYLLWTAGGIFMSGMSEMMDVRLPIEERELIEHCLGEYTGGDVRGYHGLRTRKAGRERYVDVHVQIDANKTVAEAHDISEVLEAAIRERLPGTIVTIHMEPHERP